MQRPILVLSAALFALLLAACGEADSDELANAGDSASTEAQADDSEGGQPGEPRLAPNLVSQEQIKATEAGSPGRALLEWWEAFQFEDDRAVLDMTAPDTIDAIGEEKLRSLVAAVNFTLQGIEVVNSRAEGDQGSVRVLLLTFDLASDGSVQETSTGTPRTFSMLRSGDEWLFNETPYLVTLVKSTDLTP